MTFSPSWIRTSRPAAAAGVEHAKRTRARVPARSAASTPQSSAAARSSGIATHTGSAAPSPSARRVGLPVREIAEHDDAPIDLRELADERARDGDRAVEIRRAIALGDPVERGAGRGDVRRRRETDARRATRRGRSPPHRRREARRGSRARPPALAGSATDRSPSTTRMLIESSRTMATATDVPERLSARREHFTSGDAPSSASASTEAARIANSERSSRRARRRAFGGVAGTSRAGANGCCSARWRRSRCAT